VAGAEIRIGSFARPARGCGLKSGWPDGAIGWKSCRQPIAACTDSRARGRSVSNIIGLTMLIVSAFVPLFAARAVLSIALTLMTKAGLRGEHPSPS